MSKALFINRADLVRHTPISGNLDFDKVVQYVEIAQDIHLMELLGTNLYNKLMLDIVTGSLAGRYEELVVKYIKPTLSQYAFLEFLPFSQYTLANKGVFKHTSENAELATKNDIIMMQEATRDTAQHYGRRLIDFILDHKTDFPEYYTNNMRDVKPNRELDFGGWEI